MTTTTYLRLMIGCIYKSLQTSFTSPTPFECCFLQMHNMNTARPPIRPSINLHYDKGFSLLFSVSSVQSATAPQQLLGGVTISATLITR